MSAVLDTTVLIDVLRAREPAVDYLEGLTAVPLCSELSRVEVLRGVLSDERLRTEHLLGRLRWQPVDERVSRLAGRFGRTFRRSHGLLDISDLVVAATAEISGLPLATSNLKHFPMFPELSAPY